MKSDADGSAVQTLKVAVALAVLRNKPPGISGSKYTDILCMKFKAGQQHWKKQLEKAETEILHLKQQLVMHTQTQSCDKELADSLPSDSQSLFPTPPPSGSTIPPPSGSTRPPPSRSTRPPLPGSTRISQADSSKPSAFDAQFSLGKHTEFLHHLINIRTASNTIALKGSLQDLTEESLLHSLQLLDDYIGDYALSWRMQKQCVQCIVALVDKCDKCLADSIVGKVSSLCANIIKDVMLCLKQDHKVLEYKTQVLVAFGDCAQFTAPVLNLLCDTVQTFSNNLRECVQNGKFPDTNRFSNMYYIFCAAEHCLVNIGQLSSEEKLNMKTKLEDSLLHITEQFPLIAHAIWRICGRII